MPKFQRLFKISFPPGQKLGLVDFIGLAAICALLVFGARLAFAAPAQIRGPQIVLAPSALPYYAFLSIGRMSVAYTLSLLFSLVYGRLAAGSRRAEKILLPLLDVLQSVPILSFLPVVLLALNALLPSRLAAELASITLIFTSQAWNLTYAWYQALTTLPKDLSEASTIFRLPPWLRFRTLELPFAALSLIWNSVMSWAGGWFFLMAAEIFTVGQRDFRLPGLGAYLQEASIQGDQRALLWGVLTLVLVVVTIDQLVWRPLLAWGDIFKLETVTTDHAPTSWFMQALRSSHLVSSLERNVLRPFSEKLDQAFNPGQRSSFQGQPASRRWVWLSRLPAALLAAALLLAFWQAAQLLSAVPITEWLSLGLGLLVTLLRVVISLLIALAWTLPLGVAIGTNPRLAAFIQPLVQIAASIPATALFPAILLIFLRLSGGFSIAAILLMLMGTQWYLLFNIIAGASAIPQDLKYTTTMLGLKGWERWRRLILPALFPYLVTGAITASGGAWNASIVAEHFSFAGNTYFTTGIGALIAGATVTGNYPLLLAGTLSMILAVVLINRFFWRGLYRLAEVRYRLD